MFRKNSKDSGHYHSNWLSMMYPRLFLARNLLRDDGVIFVSLDDNEVHNLRLLMNEVFGEENFIGQFIWKRRTSSALDEKNVSTDHEYVVAYSRENFVRLIGKPKDYKNYSNPDNDPNGDWMPDNPTVGMTKEQRPNQFYDLINPETGNAFPANPNRVWAWIPETMNELIKQGRIIFPKDTSKKPLFKRYKKDLKTSHNPLSTILIDDVGINAEATKMLQKMFNGSIFDYSKPLSLLKTLIKYSISGDGDVILDFFSGSGTTAHAVFDINKDGPNRKFIMVQLPEKCDANSEAYKAGFETIAEIGKERIRRVIKKIKTDKQSKLDVDSTTAKQDLGFKVFKLQQSNFKIWHSGGCPTIGFVHEKIASFWVYGPIYLPFSGIFGLLDNI
jgi:adenine-specific DNA-methyltransferase